MNPLISIIVPIYNAEKYIETCIKSILEQTHKEIQLILVNDGSTDESLSICHEYAKTDKRIIIINKENGGVSSARNAGIKSASGEYIGFVDSDDFVDQEMYAKLLKKLQTDNSECVALSKYTVRKPSPKTSNTHEVISPQDALEALFELKFPTSLWAYLYKKELIKDIRLSNKIHFFEDFEFNFKAIKNCKKISLCEENLYNYRPNELSINAQGINDKRMSCLFIYESILPEIKELNSPRLLDKALFFNCHFIIGLIIILGQSPRGKTKAYCDNVQSYSRKFLPKFITSKSIPLKHKVTIASSAASSRLTSSIIYLLRRILKTS